MAKQKILLVEDDEFLAGMYKTKLDLADYEVIHTGEGGGVLEMAQKHKPNIILLDIILPKVDGFEVLAGLKKDPEVKDIPVIMLTNLGRQEDVEKGVKLGAVDYLIKAHFVPSEVISRIKKHIK